jgi:hypothetical protein
VQTPQKTASHVSLARRVWLGIWRAIGYAALWLLGISVFIAAAFLTDSLHAHPGYRAFEAAAARLGPVILVTSAVVLVADLAAMIVYTIRNGRSDGHSGKVVGDGPLPMSLDIPMGRSKRKYLGKKSDYVSVESLIDGSATFGERMMVVGICTLFASFFLIFCGVGLILMRHIAILGLFPVVPGIVVYKFANSVWVDYREAKRKFAVAGGLHIDETHLDQSG